MQCGSLWESHYMLGFLIHVAAPVSIHVACSLVCFALIFTGNISHSSSIHLDTPNGFCFLLLIWLWNLSHTSGSGFKTCSWPQTQILHTLLSMILVFVVAKEGLLNWLFLHYFISIKFHIRNPNWNIRIPQFWNFNANKNCTGDSTVSWHQWDERILNFKQVNFLTCLLICLPGC